MQTTAYSQPEIKVCYRHVCLWAYRPSTAAHFGSLLQWRLSIPSTTKSPWCRSFPTFKWWFVWKQPCQTTHPIPLRFFDGHSPMVTLLNVARKKSSTTIPPLLLSVIMSTMKPECVWANCHMNHWYALNIIQTLSCNLKIYFFKPICFPLVSSPHLRHLDVL